MHRISDPRTTITPQSFAVAPELIGMPLAGSGRRFAAIMLDLFFLAIFLLMVRAPGTLFALTLSAVLLRITTGPGEGHVVARWGKRGLRFAAAVLIFWGALEIWQTGSDALEADAPPARVEAPDVDEQTGEADLLADSGTEWSDTAAVAYAQALRAGDAAAAAALLPRVREEVAGDTIDALIGSSRKLQRQISTLEEDRSVVALLGEMIDKLGIGFGWSALYFTAFLALGGGQTPGKRVMGIRVIRLNGKPMSWWIAFERFGGYSASLVTGLLGFLQIVWDRNRQALHDKLAETVVVRVVRKPAAHPARRIHGTPVAARAETPGSPLA